MNQPIINNIKQFLVVALLVAAQSCHVNFDDDGIGCQNGHGSLVTESRSLPAYNRVTNAISADITLRQDQNQEFRVTGHKNILNNIITSVVDGELIIDYRGCYRDAEIDIFIASPEIAGVYNVGSGDVYGDNLWQTDYLDLRITGSGTIDAEFIADQVASEITGSGHMDLFGSVDQSIMTISGSGNIFAFNLESQDQDIHISGSGNCEVFARHELDVSITGSGNVLYKGNPAVSANVTGSGNVVDAN